MSLQHILKNSSVSGKEPLASQLANGELSINYHADGPFLCCKDTAGNVRRVAGVWVSATAPSTPFPGELWLDTGITPSQLKVFKNTTDAWVFAGEVNSATTTTEGLVRLATDGETQVGTSAISAVTPAALQSKISDSTSTVSSTTLASSTAVKTVGDTANAALPKSGGTITGTLEIGNTGQLRFEGSSNDAYETTLAVEDPTSTRTITLPDRTGTVITTGDTGTVTSTMLADGTIADADINANAEIAVSKLADGSARQLLQTDAAGTGVEWTSNVDIPGTLDVTGATTLDSTLSVPLGSAAAPSIYPGTDTNTGIYSPGADQLALSTGGTGRLFVDADGRVRAATTGLGINKTSQSGFDLDVNGLSILRGSVYLNALEGISGDTSINAPGGQSIVFKDGNVENARIDSSGRLGIGTSSPAVSLDIDNATGVYLRTGAPSVALELGPQAGSTGPGIEYNVDGTTWVRGRTDAFPLAFKTNNTERLRIDSSGRLLVGTSTARSTSTVSWLSQIEGGATTGLGITTNNNSTDGAYLSLAKSRGTSVGSNTIVQSNDGLGYILFSGADGNDANTQAAYIGCEVDGTPGADDMPGRLVFSTTADGSATPTERCRIDSLGNLLFGTTTYGSNPTSIAAVDGILVSSDLNGIVVTGGNGSGQFEPLALIRKGDAGAAATFWYNEATQVGSVSITSTATAYNTSSDYRLKENVVPLTGAIDRVSQLQVHRFNFIADPSKTVDGFLAHEAQAVVPECVTGTKDEVDDEGNPVYQGIDQSKLVPLLTAALQEALAKIETLEAKVAALEVA